MTSEAQHAGVTHHNCRRRGTLGTLSGRLIGFAEFDPSRVILSPHRARRYGPPRESALEVLANNSANIEECQTD